jgi:hypothetical protein
MKVFAIAATVCLSLLALAARADPPRLGKLNEYRTAGYTLVSSGDDILMRTLVQDLARFEQLLALTLKREPRPHPVPTRIFLLSSSIWKKYLETSLDLSGEFVALPFANLILLNGDMARSHTRIALYHEYTHLFLRRQFSGYFPWWFEEGLAELMMSASIKVNSAEFGFPWYGQASNYLPLERLLRVDQHAPEYLGGRAVGAFNYQSWAFVHRGLIGDPKFSAQVFNYLQAINNLRPIEQAVSESFGMSVQELDREMRAFITKPTWRTVKHELGSVPRVIIEGSRELTDTEALWSIAALMLDVGREPDRIRPLVDALARQPPESSPADLMRMRLALAERSDAALEQAFAAVSTRTMDGAAARDAGLTWYERVRLADTDFPLAPEKLRTARARSFELLDRALNSRPDDAESAHAFGMLAAAEHRSLDAALQRLTRASTSMPAHADLAMATALVLEAAGRRQDMQAHLIDVAKYTHSLDQRKWAAQKISEIRGQPNAAKP